MSKDINNTDVDREDFSAEINLSEASFEEAIQQLEEIVDKLETGEIALEKAIQLFQRGMDLSKLCHHKLEKVEKQVHLLLEEEGSLVKKPFQIEEDQD